MKKVSLALLLAAALSGGCQPTAQEATPPAAVNPATFDTSDEDEPAPAAAYEAPDEPDNRTGTVDYYNPSTGTRGTYTLDVEYDGAGDVERITFPSGGYISEHHITDQTHNGDGTITVSTDTGREFTVEEEED